MNIAELFINDVIPSTVLTNKKSLEIQAENKGASVLFQQLLSNEQILKKDVHTDDHIPDQDLLSYLNDMPLKWLEELYRLFISQTEAIDNVHEIEIVEKLEASIQEMFTGQGELAIPLLSQLTTGFQFTQHIHPEQLTTYFIPSNVNSNMELIQLNQNLMMEQFHELLEQVSSLLTHLSGEQDIAKISPRMLDLLEQWAALEHKYDLKTSRSHIFQPSTESEAKTFSLWKELVHAFQKRNELTSSQHYESHAKVTVKDISKWLQNHLTVQVDPENQTYTQQINITNQPISKIEQYVIYMNQNEPSNHVSKQFIDQFQQVMRTSRFLSLNNGTNQLSITLRPDNLGEMMVRLTEINGEMTLKIIVSSQTTRQMLESNLHQLKHMFTPHQVVIEEREVVLESAQNTNEKQGQPFEEEEHSQQSNQEESSQFEESFETQFHEILMNEKV